MVRRGAVGTPGQRARRLLFLGVTVCAVVVFSAVTTDVEGIYQTLYSGPSRPANFKDDWNLIATEKHISQESCESLCNAMMACGGFYYTINNNDVRICRLLAYIGPEEPAPFDGISALRVPDTSTTPATTTEENSGPYFRLIATGKTRPTTFNDNENALIARTTGVSLQACIQQCADEDLCTTLYHTTNHKGIDICRTLTNAGRIEAAPFNGQTYIRYTPPNTMRTYSFGAGGRFRPANYGDFIIRFKDVTRLGCQERCSNYISCSAYYYYVNQKGVWHCRLLPYTDAFVESPFDGVTYNKDDL